MGYSGCSLPLAPLSPAVKAQREYEVKFEVYQRVQSAAKNVHAKLGKFINSESTECTIVKVAVELLAKEGISDTWYHNVPALVLLGSRSCISISGRNYQPSDERVGETNLVTVDLSPMLGSVWGDCARSYFIEHGKYVSNPGRKEFHEGKSVEIELHSAMKEFVTPGTLFSELYEFGNRQINVKGFVNLDFLGNLGHSIETSPVQRRFIDKNCNETLGSVRFFTFEPHIKKKGCNWGFKHENIYYFNESGRAVEL